MAQARIARLYSSAEVAERYGVNTRTVNRWVALGRLSAMNPSGGPKGPYYFAQSDLDAFEALSRR